MVTTTTPEFVDTEELARRTGIATSTWNKHRLNGTGPLWIRAGRRVIYRWSEVEKWLDACTRQSTSDSLS